MNKLIKMVLVFSFLAAGILTVKAQGADPDIERLQKSVEIIQRLNGLTIDFKLASTQLKPGDSATLQKHAELLKQLPAGTIVEIGVRSRAESGSETAEFILSQKRAESLRNELIKLGIAASSLTAKGYGILKSTGDQGDGTKKRVEYLITKLGADGARAVTGKIQNQEAVRPKPAKSTNEEVAARQNAEEEANTRREIENAATLADLLRLYNKYVFAFDLLDKPFLQKVKTYSDLRTASPLDPPSLCRLLSEIEPAYFQLMRAQNKMLAVISTSRFNDAPNFPEREKIKTGVANRRKKLLTLEDAIKKDSDNFGCGLN